MKRIILLSVYCIGVFGCVTKKENVEESVTLENRFFTRAEIITPVPADVDLGVYYDRKNRSLLYSEIDLNGDGLMDIIIETLTEDVSSSWSVYLCIDDNQYQLAGGIGGWPLAKEEDNWRCRGIWSYSRSSGSSGIIQYVYFDQGKHKLESSPVFEIRPGDAGTDIGNNIYEAIFNDDTRLPLRWISPASPTNDLPYLDTPLYEYEDGGKDGDEGGVPNPPGFDDGVDSGEPQSLALSLVSNEEGLAVYSGTMLATPGQIYMLAPSFPGKEFPLFTKNGTPLNRTFRLNVTYPDGQVSSEEFTINENQDGIFTAYPSIRIPPMPEIKNPIEVQLELLIEERGENAGGMIPENHPVQDVSLEECPSIISETTYIVQEERDIYEVSIKLNMSTEEFRALRKLNNIGNPSDVEAGQVLRIPLLESSQDMNGRNRSDENISSNSNNGVTIRNTIPESSFKTNAPVLTREEVLKLNPPWTWDDGTEPNRDRLYVEIDLTDSGLMDIIISDDLHTMGTGGISWSVYLCVNTNQYRELEITLGGKIFAVEEDTRMGKKLWMYWRTAANWGSVQYLYNTGSEWELSPSLDIHPGDAGSRIGIGIFDAIFNEQDCLKLRRISPASPTNDLPYLDTPLYEYEGGGKDGDEEGISNLPGFDDGGRAGVGEGGGRLLTFDSVEKVGLLIFSGICFDGVPQLCHPDATRRQCRRRERVAHDVPCVIPSRLDNQSVAL